jgi:hypothetical protein
MDSSQPELVAVHFVYPFEVVHEESWQVIVTYKGKDTNPIISRVLDRHRKFEAPFDSSFIIKWTDENRKTFSTRQILTSKLAYGSKLHKVLFLFDYQLDFDLSTKETDAKKSILDKLTSLFSDEVVQQQNQNTPSYSQDAVDSIALFTRSILQSSSPNIKNEYSKLYSLLHSVSQQKLSSASISTLSSILQDNNYSSTQHIWLRCLGLLELKALCYQSADIQFNPDQHISKLLTTHDPSNLLDSINLNVRNCIVIQLTVCKEFHSQILSVLLILINDAQSKSKEEFKKMLYFVVQVLSRDNFIITEIHEELRQLFLCPACQYALPFLDCVQFCANASPELACLRIRMNANIQGINDTLTDTKFVNREYYCDNAN